MIFCGWLGSKHQLTNQHVLHVLVFSPNSQPIHYLFLAWRYSKDGAGEEGAGGGRLALWSTVDIPGDRFISSDPFNCRTRFSGPVPKPG